MVLKTMEVLAYFKQCSVTLGLDGCYCCYVTLGVDCCYCCYVTLGVDIETGKIATRTVIHMHAWTNVRVILYSETP